MGRTRRLFSSGLVGGLALSATVALPVAHATAASPQKGSQSKPLVAPKTTPAEDTRYLSDVAKSNTKLASYVQQKGNVALQAILTDGSAFCAFLHRDRSIDTALVDVAAGAHSVESQTHLPSTVATYNTIEAVALVDLCPSEQKLVPKSVRSRLQRLKSALGTSST